MLTFSNDDKLDRKPFADRLTKAVTTLYRFADDAYVLGLNAGYGSGKTTFLRMWQNDLTQNGYKVIYLNSWETDFDDEPIISIASIILKEIEQEPAAKKAKAALHGALGVAALVGNSVVNQATGIDIQKIMTEVEGELQEKSIQEVGKKLYQKFFFKKESYEKLKESLKLYIDSLKGKPLIILVDELDRVRPDYSIKFLESIKHIFSVQGVCFVLAVDRKQLEASVKNVYGEVDFENYYRRFITQEVNLPNSENLETLIAFAAKTFFDDKTDHGINYPFNTENKAQILQQLNIYCSIFELKPRQIRYLFRIYSHFMAITHEQTNRRYNSALLRAPLPLIALFVSGMRIEYKSIGNGTARPNEIYELVSKLKFDKRNNKHKRFVLCDMLSFSLTEENNSYHNSAADILRGSYKDLQNRDNDAIMHMLAQPISDYGNFPSSESVFQEIYTKLESWKNFID